MFEELTNTIAGLLLITLLPGYPMVLALYAKKHLDLAERVLLTIISSISVNILSIFILNNLFKVPLNTTTLVIEITALTIAFSAAYLYKTKDLPYIYFEDIDLGAILKVSSIAAVLVLNFMLVYSIHSDYKYPYLLDEWHHLSEGIKFIDKAGIDHANPYYAYPAPSDAGLLETGYSLLLAEILLLTGQNPVMSFAYLPAIFSAISGLAAYVCVMKNTKSHGTGIIAMLFFAGLQSNINIAGPWFFLPLTLGFPYIYAILYLMVEALEKDRTANYAIAGIALAALGLIHPWTMALAILLIAAYLFTRHDLAGKNQVNLALALLAPLLLLSYAYASYGISPGYLAKNFFIKGLDTPVKEVTNLGYLIGVASPLTLILALAGLAYICLRNRKEERIVAFWAAFAGADIALYQISGSTVLASYEIVLYYLLLALVPLSAIGLYGILGSLDSRIRHRTAVAFLAIAVVAASAYSVFTPYYQSRGGLYKIIDDDSYAALKWLGQNRGPHGVVLSRPELSSAIYPVTKDYVVSVLGANSTGLSDNRRFFKSDCDGKADIMAKYNVSYLFLKKEDKVRCDNAKAIYNLRGVYIYEVDKKPQDNGNP